MAALLSQAALNEKIKFRANFINSICLGLIGAGGVTPLVAYTFGLLPNASTAWLAVVVMWIGFGIIGRQVADHLLDGII